MAFILKYAAFGLLIVGLAVPLEVLAASPTQPQGLTKTGSTISTITIQWSQSTDADGDLWGYYIRRGGAVVGTIYNPSTVTFTDTGLPADTGYYYTVASFDHANHQSAWSSSFYAKTDAVPDNQAPSVPTNLVVTAVSPTQINLSWNASTDNVGVVGYKIILNGGAEITTPNTSYSHTNLTPNTLYGYGVKAYDAAGNLSSMAGPLEKTTPQADIQAPTAPQGLEVSPLSSIALDIMWGASTDNVGVSGYRIYRNGIQIGTTAITFYSDSNLLPFTTYTYQIYAYDAAGNISNASASVNGTTKGAAPVISGINVSNITNTSATVNFNTNISSNNCTVNYGLTTDYGILRINFDPPAGALTHSALLSNLENGKTYHYQISCSGSPVLTDYGSSGDNAFTTTGGQVPDTTNPIVSFSNIGQGAQLAGTIAITASASDPAGQGQLVSGVAGVQFKLDGQNLGAEVLVAPYTYSWNTALFADGNHTLSATARDVSGNSASVSLSVQLVNGAAQPPLLATLSPSVNSGTAPLNGVTLNASVMSADAITPVIYTFYCNRADAGVNVTLPFDSQVSNIMHSQASSASCNYANAGSYVAKVIMTQGAQTVEARATITVAVAQNAGNGGGANNNGGGGLAAVVLAPSGAHPNGTLVLDGQTVYLIKNGKRYGFRDPEEYKSHGYKFAQTVIINSVDKGLTLASDIIKALEGTLVLDKSDMRTVYMIGTGGTKRGFASEAAFKGLGYKFQDLLVINLSDYPAGAPINAADEVHPDGALVLDGATVWWIRGNNRQGFESSQVFNTYGFSFSKIVPANAADLALSQGPLVKFRDGTLVKDGTAYYIVSDGKKMRFPATNNLTGRGYKTSNAINGNLTRYDAGNDIE